jgi:hypothetical protein
MAKAAALASGALILVNLTLFSALYAAAWTFIAKAAEVAGR